MGEFHNVGDQMAICRRSYTGMVKGARFKQMTNIRKKAIQGFNVGDRFSISREFTEKDVHLFAEMTRDYNPVHFDERFSKTKNFNGLICHGLLVASMISEIGGQIGWLASEMNFNFKRPVYFKDRITCNMVITDIDENGWATAKAEYKNQHGTLVMDAALKGIVPGVEEKGVMETMIAEGDPTNKIYPSTIYK